MSSMSLSKSNFHKIFGSQSSNANVTDSNRNDEGNVFVMTHVEPDEKALAKMSVKARNKGRKRDSNSKENANPFEKVPLKSVNDKEGANPDPNLMATVSAISKNADPFPAAIPVPEQTATTTAAPLHHAKEPEKKSKDKGKSDDKEEKVEEIIFVYDDDDSDFKVRMKDNQLLEELLDELGFTFYSLSGFNQMFSRIPSLIPWNKFTFCGGNLKSKDFNEFLQNFGSTIKSICLCFCDSDSECPSPSVKDFLQILCHKLTSLSCLTLGVLPDTKEWTFEFSPQSSSLEENFNFKIPSLKIIKPAKKHQSYRRHKDLIKFILQGAENLETFQGFQLGLLDLFIQLNKCHLIKDLELVHPSFLSDCVWVVDDYFDALKKFEGVVHEMALEKLIIIPDEGFTNEKEERNSAFSAIYTKILEGNKDSLKELCIYPISPAAHPFQTEPAESSASAKSVPSFSSVKTLKFFEFDLCREGLLKQNFLADSCLPNSISDLGALFPNLAHVELYASCYFHKYDHTPAQSGLEVNLLQNNNNYTTSKSKLVKSFFNIFKQAPLPPTPPIFPSVWELKVSLGSGKRSTISEPMLHNLPELFSNLKRTFPNVTHLKIQCYRDLRNVISAVSTNFKDIKALMIQGIGIEEFCRKNRDERFPMLIKEEYQDIAESWGSLKDLMMDFTKPIVIDLEKARGLKGKSKNQQGNNNNHNYRNTRGGHQNRRGNQHVGRIAQQLNGMTKLKLFLVGQAPENLDDSKEFEGFRMFGPYNFVMAQVARKNHRNKVEMLQGDPKSIYYPTDSEDEDDEEKEEEESDEKNECKKCQCDC